MVQLEPDISPLYTDVPSHAALTTFTHKSDCLTGSEPFMVAAVKHSE